jgi:predicted nuclease of predicted toxin-antitoxin system
MKLLIDMNLSPAWVSFLADAGVESTHWSTLGDPSAPDTQIMEYASQNGLIVFTHDLDFGALLANTKARQPSVFQIRTQDVLPTVIGDVVLRGLRGSRSQLEEGALVTVDLNRHRIRMLPI